MAEIPKSYDPQGVEQQWYDRWVAAGCFAGKVDPTRQSFAVMIPPPNVTGVLHMGHLLNNTLQDIMVRRARQEGKSALWLPGTDHAGIATQSRVEKDLRQNHGKTRHDLGRDKFIEVASEWRDKHGGIILNQLRKLGASCDWDRKVHTLDAGYSEAVLQAFVTLYERGYVYRGKRMVNWCPVSQTGLSDEEVIMKPSKGSLFKMRYEVVEQPGTFLEISTTRPETIPGDTGVAVHPEDERYKHLIGLHVWRPFPRAQIRIVGDSAVEREFGTGVLKVTPAHDRTDFDIGKRHGLPVLDVMNPDGTMNADAGPLAGMERFKARDAAAKLLEELGALVKIEPYENTVGFSERADVPIEPRLSEQWFIHYPKIEEAKRAVTTGIIKFHPERWTKTYLHWLENIQDWCVSRQLWWGHRIPVWYRKGSDRNEAANRHVSLTPPADPQNWEQDPDVLDTWASSWLWCLATIGWRKPGETTPELQHWYPTGAIATGPDIIFLWVARMIIAGLELHGPEKKTLTDDEIRDRVQVHPEVLAGEARLTSDVGGLVLFVPHFTLMEMMTAITLAAPALGDRPWVTLYRPLNQPAADAWVKAARERFGMRLASRREGFGELMRNVRAGGASSILFDQKIQSGRRLTFLGRPAAVTNLPGLVAQKHKAATRVFWAERTGFWRCVLRSTLLRSTDTAGLTRESNAWLETRLRSSDEACADWLWAHDRWRDGDGAWHEEL